MSFIYIQPSNCILGGRPFLSDLLTCQYNCHTSRTVSQYQNLLQIDRQFINTTQIKSKIISTKTRHFCQTEKKKWNKKKFQNNFKALEYFSPLKRKSQKRNFRLLPTQSRACLGKQCPHNSDCSWILTGSGPNNGHKLSILHCSGVELQSIVLCILWSYFMGL